MAKVPCPILISTGRTKLLVQSSFNETIGSSQYKWRLWQYVEK